MTEIKVLTHKMNDDENEVKFIAIELQNGEYLFSHTYNYSYPWSTTRENVIEWLEKVDKEKTKRLINVTISLEDEVITKPKGLWFSHLHKNIMYSVILERMTA